MVNLGQAVGYLMLDTSGFKNGFSSALNDIREFNNTSNSSATRLNALSSSMGKVGSSLTKSVTAPLVGIGAGFVKVTSDFQSGMSEVKAISGASASDMEKLSDKAKEMGATTKFSASESAEALKYMAMAGWDAEKMLGGLPGVMNLAAASGEELGIVSDIVTDAMTAFGMKAEEAGHFADVLAMASSKSNTNVGMLGESFKYVAPLAGALGYSVEDTAVALGTMANAGIKSSQSGTALRGLFTRLVKPTKQSAAAIEALGIEASNADGTMKPLNELLLQLRDSFSGLTDEQKGQYAAMLAGQTGMSGLLAIVNTSDEDFQKLTDSINDADGAAENMADEMQDNLGGQLTILKSTIEGIAISFGEIMMPAIRRVVEHLQKFANWINGLSEGAKRFIVGLAAVAAAIGPIMLIVSSLIKAFTTIKGAIVGVKAALALMSAPIGLILAAIVALAVAWTTNFGGIRDQTAEIFGYIMDIVKTFLSWFKDAWSNDLGYIKTTITVVLGIIETIFGGALEAIKLVFKAFSQVFKGDWEGAWNTVKDIVSTIWDTIKKAFSTFLDLIVDLLIVVGVRLLKAAKDAFENVKKGFVDVWNAIKKWFSKAVDDPVGTIKGIGQSMYDAGVSIFTFLWDGLKSVWDKIMGWVGIAVDWIKEKVKFWQDESEKVNNGTSGSKNKGQKSTDGSFLNGLSYVPYNGFTPTLHEGERVLTKEQNLEYNRNGNGASTGDTFNFYSPKALTPAESARQLKKVKRELQMGF